MRTIHDARPDTPTARQARRRAAHDETPHRRRASIQLISEGVTASYIHEISARHSRNGRPAERRTGP